MKLDIKNYPGSKGSEGVTHKIINNIPYTTFFVEGFAGSAKISFALAQQNIEGLRIVLYEKSENVCRQLEKILLRRMTVSKVDTIKHLRTLFITNGIQLFGGQVFFFDPPYHFQNRKGKRKLYDHEWNDDQHIEFISFITEFFSYQDIDRVYGDQIFCMITHPRCELYEKALAGWHTIDIQYQTRGGIMNDTIWMNYDIAQLKLLCTDYIGDNFTERQNFNRKKKRWVNRLNEMNIHERQSMLEYITKHVKTN